MRFNNLFLFSIFLILCTGFVSAVDISDGLTTYYTFDNDNISGTTILDSVRSADAVNTNALTGQTLILGQAIEIDDLADYVTVPAFSNLGISTSGDFSVCYWFNDGNSVQESKHQLSFTNGFNMYFTEGVSRCTANKFCFSLYDGGAYQKAGNVDIVADTDYFVCGVRNGTSTYLYLDGVRVGDIGSVSGALDSASGTNILSSTNTGVSVVDFKYDEMGFYNKSLGLSEIEALYFSGTGCNPVDNPDDCSPKGNVTVNESVESTAVVKQIGTVSTTGPTPVTVFSSTFEVLANDTDLYGAYSFNVESAGTNTLFCELEIDGSVVGNITRTQTPNILGSVWLQSQFFSLDAGNHTQELICQRSSGTNNIDISNAVGIGHFMFDENNQTIPHNETIFTATTSSSNFELIGQLNFTVSDRAVGGVFKVTKFLVMEWSGEYTNNAGASELLNTYVNVTNSTGDLVSSCSFYPRTVSSGGSGSVSGDCVIRNATNNTLHTINFYGRGSNAEFSIDLKAKEFIMSPEEIAGGTGFPVNTSFVGLTKLFELNNTGNNNHALANVFEKNAWSIRANETTQASFYVRLVDGTNFTTINFTRDVTSDVGVLIGHDILQNIGKDDYVSELWADCGTANCTIVGGDGIGYLTDVTTTILNAINISVFDGFNQSFNILNFTVVNGGKFTTTTGSLLYFTTDSFVNLTISSEFNGGYFNSTYLNWNSSMDLNATLNQTFISWDCIEKVSGADLNCTSPSEVQVFNYNVIGNPHTQEINLSGYHSYYETFNVSALQVETKTARMYSTNLSLTVTSSLGTPTNCTYNVTGITYPSFLESYTGTPNGSVGLINGSYNVFVDCDGFALSEQNITINSSTQTLNFNLFTENSFNFIFRDAVSLELLNGTNVTLELISDLYSANLSTTNGTIYVDLLSPELYTIRFNSDNYTERFYYFDLQDRSFNNITLYLLEDSASSDVTVLIVDDNDNALPNAYLKVLRYDINSNTYLLQEIFKTDVEGKAYIETEIGTEFYKLFVEYPFGELVYIGDPQYIESTSFTLPVVLNPIFGDDFFNSLGVSGEIVFNNVTSNFRWDYSDNLNTITGACLYVYKVSLTEYTLLNSSCADTSSGTILVGLIPVEGVSYVGVGNILYSGGAYYWGEKYLRLGGVDDEGSKKYRLSLILFLTLAIILLFAWSPSMMFVFMPMPLLIASLTQYVEFSRSASIAFMIGGFILSYWINKKG